MSKDLDTEAKILQAARAVFTQKGFAGARMQEVADTAGINKAMLHYYFRSKEKLFSVVFMTALSGIVQNLNIVLQNDVPVVEKLEALIRSSIQGNRANPGIHSFVMHELSQGRSDFFASMVHKHGMLKNIHLLREQIKVEVANGTIRPFDPMHLLVSVKALALFPFLGGPFIRVMGEMDEDQYQAFLAKRADEAVAFMRAAVIP